MSPGPMLWALRITVVTSTFSQCPSENSHHFSGQAPSTCAHSSHQSSPWKGPLLSQGCSASGHHCQGLSPVWSRLLWPYSELLFSPIEKAKYFWPAQGLEDFSPLPDSQPQLVWSLNMELAWQNHVGMGGGNLSHPWVSETVCWKICDFLQSCAMPLPSKSNVRTGLRN